MAGTRYTSRMRKFGVPLLIAVVAIALIRRERMIAAERLERVESYARVLLSEVTAGKVPERLPLTNPQFHAPVQLALIEMAQATHERGGTASFVVAKADRAHFGRYTATYKVDDVFVLQLWIDIVDERIAITGYEVPPPD